MVFASSSVCRLPCGFGPQAGGMPVLVKPYGRSPVSSSDPTRTYVSIGPAVTHAAAAVGRRQWQRAGEWPESSGPSASPRRSRLVRVGGPGPGRIEPGLRRPPPVRSGRTARCAPAEGACLGGAIVPACATSSLCSAAAAAPSPNASSFSIAKLAAGVHTSVRAGCPCRALKGNAAALLEMWSIILIFAVHDVRAINRLIAMYSGLLATT